MAKQRLADPADCGAGWAKLQLADPTGWWLVDPVAPHSCIDKLGGTVGEQSRLCTLGLQRREIKPQASDWGHLWGLRRQQEGLLASQESSLERPTGA